MDAFIHQVLAGLATGGIYASLALALVMIYQATHLVNFAQGELAMFATYIAWSLINAGMPVVFIAPRGSQYEKILGNIQEVKARGGKIIAVASEGDEHIHTVADHVYTIPETIEPLQPLLTVVPLQLLAYHAALARNCNVDKPRNLAKSVTVE